MTVTRRRRSWASVAVVLVVLAASAAFIQARQSASRPYAPPPFRIHEATIADIQSAITSGRTTSTAVVNLYLERIKAYNGACVSQPDGILGVISTIPNAGQINALATLNLRPAARKKWGFSDRTARSVTDAADNDPQLPDALEVAAAQDRHFKDTGRLVGPLHGVVIAVKDQYDTADLHTTAGADAAYANDRPPADSTFVKKLRDAGAIVLAKANMGSPQPRTAFGGTTCNPYDTERSPGVSSAGAGSSVSANLVTCAIGEETGISIRGPARATNVVGIAPTQELVSREGMSGTGVNMRTGPICKTVEDAARLLTVMAGYDARDSMTAFNVGRTPAEPYQTFAKPGRLEGVRIGVVREFMNKTLFTVSDAETIDVVDRALADLRALGATVVDPGPTGALFQGCIKAYAPEAFNVLLTRQLPHLFPVDAAGNPTTDHIATLVDMTLDPTRVPDSLSIRNLGEASAVGESQYRRALYLRKRADAAIKTPEQLAVVSKPIRDERFRGFFEARRNTAPSQAGPVRLVDMSDRMLQRHGFQQVVLACMADMNLDALTYPTTNIPPQKIGAPEEPTVNDRAGYHWTVFGRQGFPGITVPAGFTSKVYDRVPDPASPDGTRMVGPTPARLPVGIDFTGRPFAEPVILRIAAAYTAATKHRSPPPAFGPLNGE
jgi:amidase